jgi:hypothetical protein
MTIVDLLDATTSRLTLPEASGERAVEALTEIHSRAMELNKHVQIAGILKPNRVAQCGVENLRSAFDETAKVLQEAKDTKLATATEPHVSELSQSLTRSSRALRFALLSTQQNYLATLLRTAGLNRQDLQARAMVNQDASDLLAEFKRLESMSADDAIQDDAAMTAFEASVAKLCQQVENLPEDLAVEWKDPECATRVIEGPGVRLSDVHEEDLMTLRRLLGNQIHLGPMSDD